MKKKALGIVLLCGVLLQACGSPPEQDKADVAAERKEAQTGPPVGTWFLYAGSETGQRTESMDQEMTILVLEDSTYTLTLMQPQNNLNFVEKGSVAFNMGSQSMDFVVFSSTGVDFSGSEPRKLVDVDKVVPWERSAGTTYQMTWRTEWQHDKSAGVDREVMVLEAPEHETSYFVRLENRDASVPDLDAKLQQK